MKRILFVEDDKGIRDLYGAFFGAHYHSTLAETAEEGLDIFTREKFDLLITDHHLGAGMTGHDLIGKVKAMGYQIPVLMVSAKPPHDTIPNAKLSDEYQYPYLRKPVMMREIKATIDSFF